MVSLGNRSTPGGNSELRRQLEEQSILADEALDLCLRLERLKTANIRRTHIKGSGRRADLDNRSS